MSLVEVASKVSEEIEAQRKRAEYKNDPVAWAKDVGGFHLWSAQAEAARSVVS